MKNLLICNSRAHADLLIKKMLNNTWYACGIGQNLTGRRFDEVFLSVDLSSLSEMEKKAYDQWFNTVVKTKLPPGKKCQIFPNF